MAILDADKEGFLRSRTSLIQTIGRAARHINGRTILYADSITKSMQAALDETARRREKQIAFNKEHHITPTAIIRAVSELNDKQEDTQETLSKEFPTVHDLKSLQALTKKIEKEMLAAAADLEFETAAKKRDQLKKLEELALKL